MEMQLIKAMFYGFTLIVGVLFIYITVIAVLFVKHIRQNRQG